MRAQWERLLDPHSRLAVVTSAIGSIASIGAPTDDDGDSTERTATMKCKKCHRPLNDCQGCNGGRASGMFGKLTCSKCNSTGMVCSEHGGHWK